MSPAQPVNQESEYFEMIESTFVSRRGAHLMVSPVDWQLIEDWQKREIPAHIVVSAINQVFDQRQSGQRTATINSLKYCAPAIEKAYRNWLANRVGANDNAQPTAHANNPFSKESVLAHLNRKGDELLAIVNSRATTSEGMLLAIGHVLDKLNGLRTGLTVAESVNARLVEVAMTELELILDRALEITTSPDQMVQFRAETTALLAPYRANLTDEIYQQQFNNFLIKRLRESFGIPRLSLFFAK